jgi:hypothetical protein
VYCAEVLTCTKTSTLPVQEDVAVAQAMAVPGAVEHWQISVDEVTVNLESSGASCFAASSIPALSAAVTGLCDPYSAAARAALEVSMTM